MKEEIQPLTILHELLDFEARKITDAEIQLRTAVPELMQKTMNLKLKEVLTRYKEYISIHIERLEGFFMEEKLFPLPAINKVMQAIIQDLQSKISVCRGAVKDACLLASLQEINHYKICLYGTCAAFAKALDMQDAAAIFHEAEINEKHIDDRLSQLAEFEINVQAKSPSLISE